MKKILRNQIENMKNPKFLALFLLILFLIVSNSIKYVNAQEIKPVSKTQCELRDKIDFIGESIKLNFKDAELKDILDYITIHYRYSFVTSENVGKLSLTVSIDNVPWNLALNAILKSQNLCVQNAGKYLLIEERKEIYEPENMSSFNRDDNPPLFTKFINLKNLPTCFNNLKCKERLSAYDGLKGIITRRLSRKGEFEFVESSQTIIIIDEQEIIDRIGKVILFVDTPEIYNQMEEEQQKVQNYQSF